MRGINKALALAGVGVGAVAVSRLASTRHHQQDANRWLVVTVNQPQEVVAPGGQLPAPLAELGDEIEVRLRPAPGDRGTEVAAQLRAPAPTGVVARIGGTDPRQRVRAALREAKSLVETGTVVSADTAPTTRDTPAGKLLDLVIRRSGGEGRL